MASSWAAWLVMLLNLQKVSTSMPRRPKNLTDRSMSMDQWAYKVCIASSTHVCTCMLATNVVSNMEHRCMQMLVTMVFVAKLVRKVREK